MPTTPAERRVIVVGAGLAGARTVATLRAAGHHGSITVLGAEGIPPYDRPPLSKELYTRPEPAWLSDELGIDLPALADDVQLNDPAIGLFAVDDSWLVRTRRDTLEADDVVLALGSRPRRPWQRAVTLHTAADAAWLRVHLALGRVLVVGAGWIGAEIAGVAASAGAQVTVVEAGASPLQRQLGPVVGAHLAPWYEAAGVELRTGIGVEGITARGTRRRVDLADGTHLDADVVLAAVGARPATDWLTGTVPLDAAGAIPTDEAGRALGPHGHPLSGLWAVGDCAARHHPAFGPVPGGHWSAALHDPEATAAALLGHNGPGPSTPFVFSQQLGHDLALFGVPRPGDEVLLRGDPTSGGWLALYRDAAAPRADGAALVRAALAVDSPREVGTLRRLLATGPILLDAAVASDPGRRLRDAVLAG